MKNKILKSMFIIIALLAMLTLLTGCSNEGEIKTKGEYSVKEKIVEEAQTSIANASFAMEEQERQAFNSKFTAYVGTSVSGAQVRALINAVIASNKNEEDKQITVQIKNTEYENGSKNASELSKMTTTIKASSKYSVTMEYDNEGFVNKVIISE